MAVCTVALSTVWLLIQVACQALCQVIVLHPCQVRIHPCLQHQLVSLLEAQRYQLNLLSSQAQTQLHLPLQQLNRQRTLQYQPSPRASLQHILQCQPCQQASLVRTPLPLECQRRCRQSLPVFLPCRLQCPLRVPPCHLGHQVSPRWLQVYPRAPHLSLLRALRHQLSPRASLV